MVRPGARTGQVQGVCEAEQKCFSGRPVYRNDFVPTRNFATHHSCAALHKPKTVEGDKSKARMSNQNRKMFAPHAHHHRVAAV